MKIKQMMMRLVPDKIYISRFYKKRFGKDLNLKNPQTYNEKLQWLKLYDRNPLYTSLVDKYQVKDYVRAKIGDEYLIKTLGVWDSFDDIDFEKLPEKFVLKCTHDSGGVFICKGKDKFNIENVKQKINKLLSNNFYWQGREWPYKNVKPRILAEEYMEDSQTKDLRDYKFFSFDGVVKAVFVATDRQNELEETKFDFFDENYVHLPIKNGHPNAIIPPEKPTCFEEMKRLASILSKNIPQVRVDFYEVDGKVYFGEMTLFHWSGFTPFEPEEWDMIFGEWINLPNRRLH